MERAAMMSDSGEPDIVILGGRWRVPAREIWFEASHSPGPGGQHGNKAATRATLCFHLEGGACFDEEAKSRLRRSLGARIGKDGVFRLSASDTRSLSGNKALALARFAAMLAHALRPRAPRRPTRPTAASRERRLRQKTALSTLKRARRGETQSEE